MEEGRPSLTAVVAAMMRAAHVLLDDEPKILRDDLALGLSEIENEAALRAGLSRFQAEMAQKTTPEFAQSLVRYVRALMVWRSRYVEDELEKALQCGVAQYVILGAGLDSFAYRRREVAKVVRVFEVDHPATQHWKRARLHAVGVEIPLNLTFLPIDFEQQTLREGLRAGGYHLEQPGVFSWLGVVVYLTEDAIMSTLRDIASLAAGTEVIFQYEVLDSLLDAEGQRLTATLKAMGVARGEPWLSFFDPTSLRARVRELGFAAVWDVGPRKPTRDILRGVRMGYVLSPYLISWKPRLEALLNQREPRATPNKAVLVTAARLRFGLTLKGHIWAAARDGERSPFASLRENAALSGSCLPSAPLRENQALETDTPFGGPLSAALDVIKQQSRATPRRRSS